jgi:PII-like signaling protein
MISPDTGQMEDAVRTGREGLRLRIFVHEALRHARKPLYAAIVELARREGLAGAIVFRGIEGYGLHRHLHTTRLVDLSDDLPIIVEIVDTSEAMRRFVPLLDQMIPHGTATLSPVHIVTYSTGQRT